jgi:hypothetical protein
MRQMMNPKGRNLVGPEHAGQRVTFQYELPNGYLSEVVGTLEWYDEAAATFVVKNRDGDLVRVPAKGVRHGKLVPPPRPREPRG